MMRKDHIPFRDADFDRWFSFLYQYVSLGHKPQDPASTPSGPPTAQVTLEPFLVGRHELGVKAVYVTGSPGDLRQSFYTKRKKDVIEFDFGDSGKTAYFAVQVENDGKKGPWYPR
jgi:hypothetical protein